MRAILTLLLAPWRAGRFAAWRFHRRSYWWQRRSHKTVPLRLYCGLPGSGKTLLMVRDAIELLRDGENVYSNIYIRDPITGLEAGRCSTWMEMLEIVVGAMERGESAFFAWDELHLHCDAREWALTPKFLLNVFAQRRHYRMGLLGTTQHPEQVEKRLRTLVDEIVNVRPTLVRRVIRGLFRREYPLFWVERLDLLLAEVPGADMVTSRNLAKPPWWSFDGYATHEMVTGEELALYKDEDAKATVKHLQERAAALCEPAHIHAWTDDFPEE